MVLPRVASSWWWLAQYLVRREVVVDAKRTLEPRLLRPPLQLLKPSVGSGQGTLEAQASPASAEPPREPALSRSPQPAMPRALPRPEAQAPPERVLLLEKVTPPRQRVELLTWGSGPHTTPPRELLTAAGGRDHQQGCRIPQVPQYRVGGQVR